MSTPLTRTANDIGVRHVAPESISDPRVPTAEEINHGLEMQLAAQIEGRKRGWQQYPTLSINAPRELVLTDGQILLPEAPSHRVDLATSIVLPALPGGAGLIKKDVQVSLVSLVAIVGSAQDPILGQMTFQYLQGDGESATLQSVTKENSRRYRHFWVLVVGDNPITANDFVGLLGNAANGDRTLTVTNIDNTGFALGGYQVYARDGAASPGAVYTIFSDFVATTHLCQVSRFQNYADRGYIWGINGEDALDADFHILDEPTDETDITAATRGRILQILSGKPGPGKAFRRTVQNLVAGAVAGNPGREGESSSCPNGSTALANDQRFLFSNEARAQNMGAALVTASNNGSGLPVIAIGLNTQVPLGTVFSQDAIAHKIYTLDGQEQSEFGSFINLGGTGSLTWIGDSDNVISPGQQVFFVPSINFPGGSGFSIPFEEVEQAWVDGVLIEAANIRKGGIDDLDAYEAPANSGEFILVTAPERAGLHYIYRQYSITTDANGVAVAPATARGCFAFIEGVSGLIDAPVYAGLTPNTAYNALVYYTPLSTEAWQFQMKYPDYQGTSEEAFLNGAKIVSRPVIFAHTQGGGGSVFQGDAAIRYVPISMHLPDVANGQKVYSMNLPCWLPGEQDVGPTRFREIPVIAGAGLSLPQPGQILSTQAVAGSHPKSMSIKLMADGLDMGFRAPILASGGLYQIVMAFMVEKGGDRRLVVITHVSTGGKDVALDSSANVAIDTFL